MTDLRCDSGIKFGDLLSEEGVVEVKCRSNRCGHGDGVVVLHRFDIRTGELKGTRQFKNPESKEGDRYGSRRDSSVRSA